MKVIGLGGPDLVRVRFPRRELDALVDQLREHRARVAGQANEAYARARHDDRAIDAAHDELRIAERLLMQLESAPHAADRPVELLGATDTLLDIISSGAESALYALRDAHDRFITPGERSDPDALVAAARSAKTWIVLQVALHRVDSGPDDA